MIAHETPAAPDAVPNLLKVSESAFCVGLRLGRRFTPDDERWGRRFTPAAPLRGLQNANEKRTAVLRPCCVD
jgi:hypothetical protein